MSMLHPCVLSFDAAQLRALGKWYGLFQFFSSPVPAADTRAGAAVATKRRKGSKKKKKQQRELRRRLAVRLGLGPVSLG